MAIKATKLILHLILNQKSPTTKSPTLQLVENIRINGKVRQRVIISLGTHFGLPKEKRAETARTIEDKLQSQQTLWVSPEINAYAERVIKKIQRQGKWEALTTKAGPSDKLGTENPTEEVFVEQVSHGQTREAKSLLAGLAPLTWQPEKIHHWRLLWICNPLHICMGYIIQV